MKKTLTFARIIAAALMALAMGAAQARAAFTVYADDVTSNAAVTTSAPAVDTNAAAAQTNLNAKSRSGVGNSPGLRPFEMDHRHGRTDLVALAAILTGWVVPVGVVAIIFYFRHRRHKMMHETLRAMIDKGVPVTPELVATMKGGSCGSSDGGGGARQRSGRLLPGLILTGVGTALLISNHAHGTGGWIVLFIGVAFLVVWAVERNNPGNQPPPR